MTKEQHDKALSDFFAAISDKLNRKEEGKYYLSVLTRRIPFNTDDAEAVTAELSASSFVKLDQDSWIELDEDENGNRTGQRLLFSDHVNYSSAMLALGILSSHEKVDKVTMNPV